MYHNISVADRGVGMSLYDMLVHLSVPFGTNKKNGDYIGRFGVGFLSALQWGMNDNSSVTVTTSDGAEKAPFGKVKGWKAKFYGSDGKPTGLRCRIEPASLPGRGTRVDVVTNAYRVGRIGDYIAETLGFFDPERAVIEFNGQRVNDGPVGDRYNVKIMGKTEEMRIQMGVEQTKNHAVRLFSNGVLVETKPINGIDVYVDMPASVQPSIGRDELVQDRAYREAMENFWTIMLPWVETHRAETGMTRALRDGLPKIADKLDCPMENKDILARALGLDSVYVCKTAEAGWLRDFFGDGISEKVYGTMDDTCVEEWTDYSGGWGVIEPLFNVIGISTVETGLKEIKVRDVELAPGYGGKSPFLRHKKKVYRNVNHPLVDGTGTAAKYALKGELKVLTGLTEESVEDDIFIGD
jgi:hypothetical protein